MKYRIDQNEIRRAVELILEPGQVTELRVLNCRVAGEWRAGTYSGYFTREAVDDLIAAVARVEHATGCYIVPNPVKPALLARSYNRARIVQDRDLTTKDKDIAKRRWLLIDVDSVSDPGISATVAEKASAEGLITAIDYWLWEHGFPAGIIADSANGAHLMIPVRLAADDRGFCERMLKGLAKQFSTPAAKVDVSVFNASRIWKLYGTESRKGDNAPEIGREWRMSRILTVCQNELRDTEDAARS